MAAILSTWTSGNISAHGSGHKCSQVIVESVVLLCKSIHRIIDHFTVVGLVTWPLNGSEAGGDLNLIQTSMLLLCKSTYPYAN